MNEPTPSSPERNPAFYIGTGMAGLGFLLFISTFFSAAMNMDGPEALDGHISSMALRAVSGMTLMVVGGAITSIGAARRFGPRISQSFQAAANAIEKRSAPPAPQPLHCQYCNTDNDSTRNTCTNCGAALVRDKFCSGCGKKNVPEAHFCNQCGKSLV